MAWKITAVVFSGMPAGGGHLVEHGAKAEEISE